MTKLTDDELATIDAMERAASPTPWAVRVWEGGDDVVEGISISSPEDTKNERGILEGDVIGGCGCCGSPSGKKKDVDFILESRRVMRALIDEVMEARGKS